MRALVWHGAQSLRVDELDPPGTTDDHVRLRVRLAAVCGSDLHGYRGHPGPRVPPLVLGHEAVGTVDGRAGRFVPFPLASCGACRACDEGDVHLCVRRGLLGLDRPGVFAEDVAVPVDALVAVPDVMSDRVAVLAEPVAVCVAALDQDAVAAGDRILVVGGGPIGLLTVHAALARGAEVEVVEPLPRRRSVAASFGAEAVHADGTTVAAGAFDVAYDAVGIEPAWRTAIGAVRRGGRATIVGLGSDEGAVPVGSLVRQAITLRGHYAYTRAAFDDALRLLARQPPPLDWMDVVDLDQGAEAFARLVAEPDTTIKVAFEIGP
jgi:threonine dehydrogenase-like Zn-dependent dehydrogenase